MNKAAPPNDPRTLLEFGPFRLLPDGRVVRHGVPLTLRPKERAVLRLLVEARGDLVPKEHLVRRAWGGTPVGDDSLTRCIHHIRRGLGTTPDGRDYIETAYGAGYRLAVPVTRVERDRLLVLAPAGNAPDLPRGDSGVPDRVREALLDRVIETILETRDAGVSVIGAATAWRCQVNGRRPETVATELDADLVATLAPRVHDGQLEVTVSVTRAAGGIGLGRTIVTAARDDLASLAADAAGAILDRVRRHAAASAAPRLARAMRTTPRVYEAYLEARSLFRKRGADRMRQAMQRYAMAAEWDPHYAPALIGLAECYLNLPSWTALDLETALREAEPLLARAEAIEPNAHGLRALRAAIASGAGWRFADGERLFREALEDDGADTNGYLFYGRHLLGAERPDAAIEALGVCTELDPLSPAPHALLAYALWCTGRTGDAFRAARRALDLEPDSTMPLVVIAMMSGLSGEPAEGLHAAQRALEVTGPLPIVLAAYADACARAGMPDEARRVLGSAAATPGLLGPSLFAPAAFALGDSTEGAAWLERALARRCLWLPVLRVDPRLAPFRSEPRVRAVFDQIPSLREDADGAR